MRSASRLFACAGLAALVAGCGTSGGAAPDQSAFLTRIETMDCVQLQGEGDRIMAARDRYVSDALAVSGRNATSFRAETEANALRQLRLLIDQAETQTDANGEICVLRVEDRRLVRVR